MSFHICLSRMLMNGCEPPFSLAAGPTHLIPALKVLESDTPVVTEMLEKRDQLRFPGSPMPTQILFLRNVYD